MSYYDKPFPSASLDRWLTTPPDDGDDEAACEVCEQELDEAPDYAVVRFCDDCGLCQSHCHGHADDELAADQGLDDDIDF